MRNSTPPISAYAGKVKSERDPPAQIGLPGLRTDRGVGAASAAVPLIGLAPLMGAELLLWVGSIPHCYLLEPAPRVRRRRVHSCPAAAACFAFSAKLFRMPRGNVLALYILND
jgi:hypothetical protein